jgi:hypothetical protein
MNFGRPMEVHCRDQCDGFCDDDEFDNGGLSTNIEMGFLPESTCIFDEEDQPHDFDSLENYIHELPDSFLYNPDEPF